MSGSESALVVVDYADIADPSIKDLGRVLARAFGGENEEEESAMRGEGSGRRRASSLGIIAIRGVPNFVEAKRAFLPLGHTLAHLPQSYLDEHLTDVASMYNAGWSHGKEKLGNKPDYAKGSFYFNPLTDVPGTVEDRAKYPASYPTNIWPTERIPEFEAAAKRLGTIMHDAVVHLAKHIDAYARQRSAGYPDGLLHGAMQRTEKAKGRLLYYFPLEDGESDGEGSAPVEDSWIGWHNDSGFLTALAGDLYVDDRTGEPVDRGDIDPAAGLYVMDRDDRTVRVDIPDDCMAVQLGECVQIITGGAVVATPHCVRGARSREGGPKVARISHPCFIDTVPNFQLTTPIDCSRKDVIDAGVGNEKVPPLKERWTEGMAFGDFLQKTFSMYYDWSSKEERKEDE